MLRRRFNPVGLEAALCGGLLLAPAGSQASGKNSGTVHVQVAALHPYTHFAYVPAGADLSTIRFEKARLIRVPAKIRYTSDTRQCAQAAFREPGGSMYCPYAETGSREAAYEITYSYHGPPLASDEHAQEYSTFQVYFDPGELSPKTRQALAGKKQGRRNAAGYFRVTTHGSSSASGYVIVQVDPVSVQGSGN